MCPAAAAAHRVLVVLGDPRGDPRDLVLLVAVGHPQVGAGGQVRAALAGTLGEPVGVLVGGLGPGQVGARRPRLLAPSAARTAAAALRRGRRRPARVVVPRRRGRGVLGVPRQQVLQPGQLDGQRLVGLDQLRHLGGHRGDLPVLRRDPPGLPGDLGVPLGQQREQLIAGQLLRCGHPRITPHPPTAGSTDTPTPQQSQQNQPSQTSGAAQPTLSNPVRAECSPGLRPNPTRHAGVAKVGGLASADDSC